ncbi:hypothetical protein JCM19037_2432 [Geomicrobium sp. JCM 19037]|uniref:bacillithiol biosynthesis cysteine-adding enzyme BshC n=1 Tax=Geomicrobium sp. JCM 19037 TaxID=1460634 RepID=UPI00045F1AE6|nr:bacillithiol biosynthesis cysteine-adding enzyme BshC [Geomicrobium sp. JCM 19037]GAK04060.1 hypothetical protein JCM19037_2432 [Geomicrobium sp. JCM 19037]
MTIESYSSIKEGWLQRYAEGESQVASLYDYRPSGDERRRHKELMDHSYDRSELQKALQTYQSNFLYNEQALEQIKKFSSDESTVIVGGQQAGLFTGPIYTIAKALSIVEKAKEQEAALGTPVVPVFWIAGEDHDWEEVNHVYVHTPDNRLQKVKYEGHASQRVAVTNQKLDEQAMRKMIDELFYHLGETEHTKELHHVVSRFAKRSNSPSRFFAELLLWLFKDDGLVVMDAEEPVFRSMMADLWQELLLYNDEVRGHFATACNRVEQLGEEPFILLSNDHTHLFYKDDGYREKIVAHDDGDLSLESGRFKMSKGDWSEWGAKEPDRFSSNVYTRPFAQERMLPVLGFVSGPGELKYWSMVQPLFHQFRRQVPPVIPRVQQTFVDRKSAKALQSAGLPVIQVTEEGTKERQWKLKRDSEQLDTGALLEASKPDARQALQPLREALLGLSASEERFANKKYDDVLHVLEEMQARVDLVQYARVQPEIERLKFAEHRLSPEQKPQERMLNILQVLNEGGVSRFRQLMSEANVADFEHHILYI